MAGFCANGNETSGFTNYDGYLDLLKTCENFRKGWTSWVISSFFIRTSFVERLLPYTSGQCYWDMPVCFHL